MVESVVERELKFDVDPHFVLPGLADLLPPQGRLEHASDRLCSDYFDTGDRALVRARMVLRRRTGTSDNGWQLKVPLPPFREEIRFPLEQIGDSDVPRVPDEVAQLLRGTTLGRALVPVAHIAVDRSVTRLLDGDRTVLAEIVDDQVHATTTGADTTPSTWRELEVQLGGDDVALLDTLAHRLREAGARLSRFASKLEHVLADGPVATRPQRHRPVAGDVIERYIAEQQRVLAAGDLSLRRGDTTALRKTRGAAQRLRSTLHTFASLFDNDRARSLDAELRWCTAVLGEARAPEVLRRRLDELLGEVDVALVIGPVQARFETALQHAYAERWQRLQDELNSSRYLSLLADVADWVDHPPTVPAALRSAGAVEKLFARSRRRAARRLERAAETSEAHLLRAARKAVERARHAAEAAEPVLGRKLSKQQARRYEQVQDLLGEYQDSVAGAELLWRLGAAATTPAGENGFTFGLLYEREQRNAVRACAKIGAAAHDDA